MVINWYDSRTSWATCSPYTRLCINSNHSLIVINFNCLIIKTNNSYLRLEQIKQVLIVGQSSSKLDDMFVYMGQSRLYGHGFGDFICNIFRTVTPVIMRVGKALY